jgi:hypothetical protein
MRCFVTHPFLSRSNSRKVCLKSSMDNGSDEGPPGCCGAPYMALREGLSTLTRHALANAFYSPRLLLVEHPEPMTRGNQARELRVCAVKRRHVLRHPSPCSHSGTSTERALRSVRKRPAGRACTTRTVSHLRSAGSGACAPQVCQANARWKLLQPPLPLRASVGSSAPACERD